MFCPEKHIALQMGDLIVGWLPTDLTPKPQRIITGIASNGASVIIDVERIQKAYSGVHANLKRYSSSDFWVYRGGGDVFLQLPDSMFSTNSSGERGVIYTDKTVRTIHAALTNYYTLLKQHIGKEINAQSTQLDIMQTMTKFFDYYKSRGILRSPLWKGSEIDEALKLTSTIALIQRNSGEISEIGLYQRYVTILEWTLEQTYAGGDITADRQRIFAPDNVLYIVFENKQQLEDAKPADSEWRRAFETAVKDEFSGERIFVLGTPDDPLKSWTVGQTISASCFTV